MGNKTDEKKNSENGLRVEYLHRVTSHEAFMNESVNFSDREAIACVKRSRCFFFFVELFDQLVDFDVNVTGE
jgi:hypothetical protein